MENGAPLTKKDLMAWIARGFMVAAVTVGVPIFGYLLTHILARSEEVVAVVHSHDTSLELLKQGTAEIKDKINDIHVLAQDHENRIRNLERGPR